VESFFKCCKLPSGYIKGRIWRHIVKVLTATCLFSWRTAPSGHWLSSAQLNPRSSMSMNSHSSQPWQLYSTIHMFLVH